VSGLRIEAAPQRLVFAAGMLVAALVAARAAAAQPRLALLFAIGVLLGVTLYHAAFGFASAYRRLLFERDATAVRAQLLMLALATLLFAPVLARGDAYGASAPLGVQVALGAFLFGIGMQLGGGCGSGTLYAAGGGSARMLVVLAAFCGGGFWASLHMDRWQALPGLGEVVLGERLGWASAALLQVFILGAIWLWVRRMDASTPRTAGSRQFGWRVIFSGPWPLAAGAVLLALLNFATLNAAGHPWSITWGFTLWAAKVARLAGWNPDEEPFWRDGFARDALDAPVLEDVTSLMDVGILVGALLAASLAGRFAPVARIDARGLASALAGGLLMGYGARIAYGCNIGAFFSGVASTSLHGWLWIAAALPGCWLGGRLRPFFRLAN
jgi:hypothetical protein